MHKTLRIGFFTLLMGLNISCVQPVESLLDGAWALEKIVCKGKDIFEEKVFTNMMSFNNDNTFSSPRIGEGLSWEDSQGNWSFNEEYKQLNLTNKNKYLNGTFDLCFKWKKEKGNLVMVLESNDTYMEIVKVISPTKEITILPLECEDNL
jgi:hypothetical protein